MSSILPQLIQALAGGTPANAQAAAGGGKLPGKSPAEQTAPPRQAQPAQEPAALSVLRMLGMVR